jgi:hypothetical protein
MLDTMMTVFVWLGICVTRVLLPCLLSRIWDIFTITVRSLTISKTHIPYPKMSEMDLVCSWVVQFTSADKPYIILGYGIWVLLIVKDLTVIVKWRTALKVCTFTWICVLSVKLDSLSCSIYGHKRQSITHSAPIR